MRQREHKRHMKRKKLRQIKYKNKRQNDGQNKNNGDMRKHHAAQQKLMKEEYKTKLAQAIKEHSPITQIPTK